jgi:ubiquinone/menaquinone biosynthesis C-methylase UbiE
LLPAIFQQIGCQAFGTDLDAGILSRGRLHPALVAADAFRLPFETGCFQMVTTSNLLFLLKEPQIALLEMARVTAPNGQVCALNPSERLTVSAASQFADQRGLDGLAHTSLINWAVRAEDNPRWTKNQMEALFTSAGLIVAAIDLKIGPGFALYTRGIHPTLTSIQR